MSDSYLPGAHQRDTPSSALTRPEPTNLADLLERVLDKGVVIAGDIRVNLLDIELLTVRIRLLLVSVDKAKEMGIDWWEADPMFSSRARRDELRAENQSLRERVQELETQQSRAPEVSDE